MLSDMEIEMNQIVLPNEILDRLLSYFSTTDLFHARLVSKAWRSMASAHCRLRHVKLKGVLHHERRNPGFYISLFQDVENLPWSACEIQLPKSGKIKPFERANRSALEFFEKFGSSVRKLSLNTEEGNYGAVIRILSLVPILESFLADITTATKRVSAKFPTSGITFPKLRQLGVRVRSDSALEFFKWILSVSGVKELGVTLGPKYLPLVTSLSTNVPFIYVEFPSVDGSAEHIQALSFNPGLANIRQVQLNLHLPFELNFEFYEAVQTFLENVAPHLESLIFGFRGSAYPAVQFDVPQMANLKCLNFMSCVDQNKRQPPLYILKPFSDQFPSLEKVVLKGYYSNQHHIQIFSSCQFETVRELVVFKHDSNPMTDDWARVFPNLTKLVSAVDAESLRYILGRMTKLEHLRLRILFSNPKDDVNEILSGVSALKNISGDLDDAQQDAQRQEPSLHSLKQLKKLELKFRRARRDSDSGSEDEVAGDEENDDDEDGCFDEDGFAEEESNAILRDAGVHFALLQIQPLELLSLCNAKLSEDAILALNSHHQKVQMLAHYQCSRFNQPNDTCGFVKFRMEE